jgi:hypothetical protein
MLTKTCLAAIAASLLIAPIGVAYSVGTADQKTTEDANKAPNAAGADAMDKDKGASSPADQAAKKTWTKADAKKAGITDEQFKAADVNHDGKLDEKELKAAGLVPKK